MKRIVVIAMVVGGLSGPLWAGAVEAGPEFQVNLHMTEQASYPSLAVDAAGNFVVVWQGCCQENSSSDIFGRRFDGAGLPQGYEFQFNTFTSNRQSYPSVAMDGAGNFVAAWASYGQDGSYSGVFGRRYDITGAPLGPEFQINTHTPIEQRFPALAIDEVGDFVVVWESQGQDGSHAGIFGQRFDSAGIPHGSEFQVNTYTAGEQARPSVAVDGTGDFVVVWQSEGQDGSGYGIFARRFDRAGVPESSEFQVNTYTTGMQTRPSVALDGTGDFMVVWQSEGQDGSGYGIFAQRFDRAGVPQGSEFQVNTYTTYHQRRPSVAADGSGSFVVVWDSDGQEGSSRGIFGQRFDSAGTPQGFQFQANTHTTGWQTFPSVAIDEGGDFVVVWKNISDLGQSQKIFGQRFVRLPEIADPLAGDTLDCRDPRLIRPTLTWDDDGYDRFRVLIAWDPDFGTGRQVTSGDTLLRTTTWTPPAKKWRKACARAVEANQESPALYIKVFGVDRDLPKSDPARKRYSPVVQVTVQP